MEKRYLKIIVYLFIALAMGGCVYDFTPDSKDLQGLDKPLLVIEGDIIVGGTTIVKLGCSESVLSGIENGDIEFMGASVWVESESGENFYGYPIGDFGSMVSSSSDYSIFGINTEDLSLDGRYRLCVSVPGRGEYRSAFKSVSISPQIDSISYSFAEDGRGVQFEVSTHNDSQKPLYCRWSFTEDWESNAHFISRLKAFRDFEDNSIKYEDRDEQESINMSRCYSKSASKDIYIGGTEKLSENIIYKARLNTVAANDRRVSSLYAINVTQTAMDKEAFKYWEGIKASISGTGGLFAPMPNEVRGNIKNDTYPDENVLGYINVSTATHMRRFVYAIELHMFKMTCNETAYPDSVWMELYIRGDVPIRYGETDKGTVNKNEVYWTSAACGDCTTFSNSTRPDYWPSER